MRKEQTESAWTSFENSVTCPPRLRLDGDNLAESNLWQENKAAAG
jgi:hypothetical protein